MTRTFIRKHFWHFSILFFVATLLGCGATSEMPLYDGEADASRMVALPESAPDAEFAPAAAPASGENTTRKIHFSGEIGLLVSNPRTTIKLIVDLVNARKGYVERISSNTITVHVPANSFEGAFKEILEFGKVLRKTVSTQDISDQYRATELRLKIARATRKRLLALLKQASVEEDKLALLTQIEEITATIETLEAQFELLKTKVRYSKITVSLTSYSQFDSRYRGYEPSGFYWINQLAPQDETLATFGDRLEFLVPQGMLRIRDIKGFWSAQSGDKAMFRAARRNNEPNGDKAFWLQAIKLRLESKYQSVQTVEVGDYVLLRLSSYDAEPYIYYVGLKVDKDALKLVELYFPNAALEEKYINPIFDSIKAGET